MSECQWKPRLISIHKCTEPPLEKDPKGYCLLHSPIDKNEKLKDFTEKINEKMEADEIDFWGVHFPPNFDAHFFSKRILGKTIVFSEAKFSSELHFYETKFERAAYFNFALFKNVKFNKAIFSEVAEFLYANLGNATFKETEFLRSVKFSHSKFSFVSFDNAKFSESVDFGKSKFYDDVSFNSTRFIEMVDFSVCTFYKSAVFSGTTFLGNTLFSESDFRNGVSFQGVEFVKGVNFAKTSFNGITNFSFAKFLGNTIFHKNSRYTFAELEDPFEDDHDILIDEFQTNFPIIYKTNIVHDVINNRLVCEKVITENEEDNLLNQLNGKIIPKIIIDLCKRSKEKTLGNPSFFLYSRFKGETIFEEVNLSKCFFRNSILDKVDFRNCKFNETTVKLLFRFTYTRKNVLKDELYVDERIRNNTNSGYTEDEHFQLRLLLDDIIGLKDTNKENKREGYFYPRHLYQELKKNFEDKKDWDAAGDFHYGEMECRRKMKGWWGRKLSLLSFYCCKVERLI